MNRPAASHASATLRQPSRERLETLLRKLARDEISVADAVAELLQVPATETPPMESIQSLTERLGTPPDDIVARLPAGDASEWAITAEGSFERLDQRADAPARVADATAPVAISSAAQDRISGNASARRIPTARSNDVPPFEFKNGSDDRAKVVARPRPVRRRTGTRRRSSFAAWTVVMVGLGVGITAWSWQQPGRERPSQRTSNRSSPSSAPTDSVDPAVFAPRQTAVADEKSGESDTAAATAVELETLDTLVLPGAEPAELTAKLADLPELTDPQDLVASLLRPVADLASDPEPESAAESELEPRESVQATRVTADKSIQLGPRSQVEPGTQLFPQPCESLRLEFPFDVPLVLAATSDHSGWQVRDREAEIVVATVRNTDTSTSLQWAPIADQSRRAASLVHGRLTNQAGEQRYLRPLVDALPLRLEIGERESRLSWDLLAPVPASQTRLGIDVQVPDTVDLAWIEPVDPSAVRRAKALLVASLRDSETVAMAIRLDIRCTRQLTVRLRYAARLAPDSPWHLISPVQLDQTHAQLTSRLMAIAQQVSQLDALSGRAGAADRRVIRLRLAALGDAEDYVRELSQRIVELRELTTRLSHECRIRFAVTVHWPDHEQAVFRMREAADDAI